MAKGIKTGGGSRKGKPNKGNAELKELVLGALADEGGREYLRQQARDNPSAFMSLVGKFIPRQHEGEFDHRHLFPDSLGITVLD